MDRATFLTRVVLENYKSIAHCDVRLGPLNYLVGPNGAGKSNFLDALRFVAEGLNSSLDVAVRQRGGLAQMIRRAKVQPEQFGIRLELSLPERSTGLYEIKIGLKDGTLAEVVSGLTGVDTVVKANAASLTDGQPVEVFDAAKPALTNK